MITKGTLIAYGIVSIIILHKICKDLVFPSMLYVFALSLMILGIYYFYFGWIVYALVYAVGGTILLLTLWKT